jgi:hypothetical protein
VASEMGTAQTQDMPSPQALYLGGCGAFLERSADLSGSIRFIVEGSGKAHQRR